MSFFINLINCGPEAEQIGCCMDRLDGPDGTKVFRKNVKFLLYISWKRL